MKQLIQKISILCVAALIFFVGAGFTVIDFCCSGCIEEQFFAENHKGSCCSSDITETTSDCAEGNTKHKAHTKCTNPHEGECYTSERVSIDLDNRTFKPDLSNISASAFIHCFCCCFSHEENIVEDLSGYHYTNTEPLPPREYLSLIRVLII